MEIHPKTVKLYRDWTMLHKRMHGASLIDTMGVGMIFLGLMVQAGFTLVTVKLLMICAFVLWTTPTATHALARAARVSGIELWEKSVVDQFESESAR